MADLVLLPQRSGSGYYPYSPTAQQYGTDKTVEAIVRLCDDFFRNMGTLVGIGDMSYADGRAFPPHQSHRNGKAVDVRPIRKDKASAPINISSAEYDRDATSLLARSITAHANVLRVLFNDRHVPGVIYYPGHDNHLHVIMKS